MTLQEILDIWVDRGAVIDFEDVSDAYQLEDYPDRYRHLKLTSGGVGYSINDILYGNSNFRQALFSGTPEGGKVGGKHWKNHMMESMIHKDKVKYLSDLLSKQWKK